MRTQEDIKEFSYYICKNCKLKTVVDFNAPENFAKLHDLKIAGESLNDALNTLYNISDRGDFLYCLLEFLEIAVDKTFLTLLRKAIRETDWIINEQEAQ